MNYFVIGPDGAEYGPASVDTLRAWVAENRVLPTTMLKSEATGQTAPASSIPALFPSAAPQQAQPAAAQPGAVPPGSWSQPPTANYPRSAPGVTMNPQYAAAGKRILMWSIGYSAAALVSFFAIHGLGLIFGAYGVVYAFRAQASGHRLAGVAIAISVVTLAIIGIGWFLRFNGAS